MRTVVLALAAAPLLSLMQGGTPQPVSPRTTGGFAPLEYFENNCSRCHGNYGSAYGETFGTSCLTPKMLRMVREMAEGPGQAPLPEPDLKTETDFHLALRDKRPYAVITRYKDGGLVWRSLTRLDRDFDSRELSYGRPLGRPLLAG